MKTHYRPNVITRYWWKYYVDPATRLCALCGNTGRIDTRTTAVSHAGIGCGAVLFCICPNGQADRQREDAK